MNGGVRPTKGYGLRRMIPPLSGTFARERHGNRCLVGWFG